MIDRVISVSPMLKVNNSLLAASRLLLSVPTLNSINVRGFPEFPFARLTKSVYAGNAILGAKMARFKFLTACAFGLMALGPMAAMPALAQATDLTTPQLTEEQKIDQAVAKIQNILNALTARGSRMTINDAGVQIADVLRGLGADSQVQAVERARKLPGVRHRSLLALRVAVKETRGSNDRLIGILRVQSIRTPAGGSSGASSEYVSPARDR